MLKRCICLPNVDISDLLCYNVTPQQKFGEIKISPENVGDLRNRLHDSGVTVMSIRNILKNEMNKSGGSARLVKVPDNRRPTAETLKNLEQEISAQIISNEVMRSKSMHNASRTAK